MLNANSPTVQALLNSTPPGTGNMPVYFGNTPTMTTETQPVFSTTLYPSPKEMMIQSGQQAIYHPASFGNNIVGAANPAFQAAFSGYINPYMGYGYGPGYCMPMDDETRRIMESAAYNNLTYEEEVYMECGIYKHMSRIVSINLGRSEEESKQCEEAFNPYLKNPPRTESYSERKERTPMKVCIMRGDKVINDPDKVVTKYTPNQHQLGEYIKNLKSRDEATRTEIARRAVYIHENALERSMDNIDLVDFFNNNAGRIINQNLLDRAAYENMTRSSLLYNKQKFAKLFENNNIKPRAQRNAIERFTGMYGYMPDGRPVMPSHNPTISSSFAYDPITGQMNISPPGFIKNRLEQARLRFIESIGK